ncbi:hypothetical protein CPF_1334 [Clostridium perfringens ATCC 13124]|uniref:Uncharacterized protein n=2 Tax=Clostridium perfringens TaxID=1502 RepID=A0A0H2YPX8_CLOP1|nr:hypothetical protein CPF_1334 [Clostridium perfringens ATCC 13124]
MNILYYTKEVRWNIMSRKCCCSCNSCRRNSCGCGNNCGGCGNCGGFNNCGGFGNCGFGACGGFPLLWLLLLGCGGFGNCGGNWF